MGDAIPLKNDQEIFSTIYADKMLLRHLWHTTFGWVLLSRYFSPQTEYDILRLAGVAVCLFEITRLYGSDHLRRWFNQVMNRNLKPSEHHGPLTSVYYVTGCYLAYLLADLQTARTAVITLAFADPAAALAGRLVSSRSLNQKTAIGSIAALAVTSTITYYGCQPSLHIALIVGVTVSLAERYTSALVDDNIVIPLAYIAALKFTNYADREIALFTREFIAPSLVMLVCMAFMLKSGIPRPPLDGGFKLGGHPIFGPNKSVTGFVTIIAGYGLGYWCFNLGVNNGLMLGTCMALSELPNSFIKRRVLDSTKTNHILRPVWDVIDQLDICMGFFAYYWAMVTPRFVVINTVLLYLVHKFEDLVKQDFIGGLHPP